MGKPNSDDVIGGRALAWQFEARNGGFWRCFRGKDPDDFVVLRPDGTAVESEKFPQRFHRDQRETFRG